MLWWPTPQSVPSCQPKFPFTRSRSVWLLYQMHAGGPGPADTHGNYWLIRKNKCLAQIQNFLCWIVPSADYKDNLVLGKSYDFVSHLNPVANTRLLVSIDASFTIQRATKHSSSYVSLPAWTSIHRLHGEWRTKDRFADPVIVFIRCNVPKR